MYDTCHTPKDLFPRILEGLPAKTFHEYAERSEHIINMNEEESILREQHLTKMIKAMLRTKTNPKVRLDSKNGSHFFM